jgi:hypothetical protein
MYSEVWEGAHRLVVNLAAPTIVSLQSDGCSLNSTALELLDCRAERDSLQLEVCLDNVPEFPTTSRASR